MKKKNNKIQIFPIIGWSLATLWVVIFLAFLFWMGITSLKNVYDFKFNPFGLPRQSHGGWMFSNYARAFESVKIVKRSVTIRAWDMVGNSIIYALGKSICALIPPCLVSYLVAKYNYIPFV